VTGPPTLREIFAGASWPARLRLVVDLATPWGFHWLRDSARKRRALARIEAERRTQAPSGDQRYEQAVRFLLGRGLDEREVREGSMPEESLDYVAGVLAERLPGDQPVRALHVGNFVGVSLCCLCWSLRERHRDSVVVSIDPNIPHRGIVDPQQHAFALLDHFGLLDMNVVVQGYTVGSSPLEGTACEHVLASLGRVAPRSFDVVLLDGDHDEAYLERELSAVRELLTDEGVIVFDDVNERTFAGVVRVFERAAAEDRFSELGQDGRVGIVQVA